MKCCHSIKKEKDFKTRMYIYTSANIYAGFSDNKSRKCCKGKGS